MRRKQSVVRSRQWKCRCLRRSRPDCRCRRSCSGCSPLFHSQFQFQLFANTPPEELNRFSSFIEKMIEWFTEFNENLYLRDYQGKAANRQIFVTNRTKRSLICRPFVWFYMFLNFLLNIWREISKNYIWNEL